MTWICKKCGQIQPDSIIYGDGICDDCYEKINKKKKKGSAFNKILSLALVLSFMFCIFSGFGIASAAEIGTQSEIELYGSYMDYDVIKFDIEQRLSALSIKALYDKYFPTFDVNNHLAMFLFEFDENGNPLFYCTYGRSGNPGGFTWNMHAVSETSHYLAMTTYSAIAEDMGVRYNYIDVRYNATHTILCHQDVGSTSESGAPYSIDMVNGVHGAYSGSFVSDTRYLLFAPYNSNETDGNNILPTLLNGTRDSDFVLESESTSPKANFYTCKSSPYTDTSHGLYIKSWLKDGNQYPYFGWWINDNGNNHKYKVVFSYNDTQKELFETFYKSTKSNPLFSDGWWVEKAFPILSVSKESMIIANEIATQTGFADFMANKTWWLWHYNTLFTLEHSSMDFTNSTSSNKIYTINLSDYSSIYEYLFYRAQIVDITTGNILDTVYFTSQESFNKSDSGYGSKVYDYGDNADGMIDDLINDDPSVDFENHGKFNVDGDTIDTPIIDENGNAVWDNINIGGMYYPLSFGLSSVSDFFQSLWIIYPNEIKSIIISGISLIVILRILGR